ncbi:Hypothetical protein NTJ_01728 [Nesidiocoris tenuis]|uniref:Uncharacterized protein n=1 Tax=Nesidiocoris tenuis TaxID=355587 RepID=A0ABN7ADI6_9HEMI|nr:Hypothetical protein NTJ_01728 [Nesidiocoris tenuis]
MKSLFKKLDSAADEIKLILTQGRKAKESLDPKAVQMFKVENRQLLLKNWKGCRNCFSTEHTTYYCADRPSCTECNAMKSIENNDENLNEQLTVEDDCFRRERCRRHWKLVFRR